MKQFLKNISPFNNRLDMPSWMFVIKKFLAFWVCYIAGLLIAEGAAILLYFAMGKNLLVGNVFGNQTDQLIQFYGYIIIIGVVLIYWKAVEKKPFAAMGLGKGFGIYIIGALAGIFVLFLCVGAIVLTGSIEFKGIFQKIDYTTILLFLGAYIIQGAMEEFLCRGMVLHALKEKTSLAVAIAVSTVLFILPHWSSLFAGETIYGVLGAVNIALVSVVFSLLVVRYRNIWAACGFHSFWNAVIYSVLGLNLSGNEATAPAIFNMHSVGENIWNGGAFGIEASAVTTVVLSVTAALLWVCNKKFPKKN